MTKFRVGILGAAHIAKKTAIAISKPESDCVLAAVASRSLDKAQKFVQELFPDGLDGIQILGGDSAYSDLIALTNVDALYIPLPVTVKKEWVLKALKAGKHCLIEKPAALTALDYQEMSDVAHENHCFLLDGTMFPHHPRTQVLAQQAANQEIMGMVKRIQCQFCFATDAAWEQSNIRASAQGDPHGCLGDLGWYCVRFGLLVFRAQLPAPLQPISVQVIDWDTNAAGVPMDATCCVRFQEGRVLWFHCGFKTAFRQSFEVCGSKKFLLVDDLVLPKAYQASYRTESSHLTQYDLLTVYDRQDQLFPIQCTQEVLMWKNFAKLSEQVRFNGMEADSNADKLKIAEAQQWASDTLLNQKIVDALMESLANSGKVVELF